MDGHKGGRIDGEMNKQTNKGETWLVFSPWTTPRSEGSKAGRPCLDGTEVSALDEALSETDLKDGEDSNR